jgi:hypothetical protein
VDLEGVALVLLLRQEAVRRVHDDAPARDPLHHREQPQHVRPVEVLDDVEGDDRVEAARLELVLEPHDVHDAVLVVHAGLGGRREEVDADRSLEPPPKAPERRVRPAADVQDRPCVADRALHQLLGRGSDAIEDGHGARSGRLAESASPVAGSESVTVTREAPLGTRRLTRPDPPARRIGVLVEPTATTPRQG